MKWYSAATCPFSQRCRIVLHEKGLDFQIIDVEQNNDSIGQPGINPYGNVPTLVDRDLVLHEANIINEYIDDRFPHPRLMPVDLWRLDKYKIELPRRQDAPLLDYAERLFSRPSFIGSLTLSERVMHARMK